jgi:hypothetical protein
MKYGLNEIGQMRDVRRQFAEIRSRLTLARVPAQFLLNE